VDCSLVGEIDASCDVDGGIRCVRKISSSAATRLGTWQDGTGGAQRRDDRPSQSPRAAGDDDVAACKNRPSVIPAISPKLHTSGPVNRASPVDAAIEPMISSPVGMRGLLAASPKPAPGSHYRQQLS